MDDFLSMHKTETHLRLGDAQKLLDVLDFLLLPSLFPRVKSLEQRVKELIGEERRGGKEREGEREGKEKEKERKRERKREKEKIY